MEEEFPIYKIRKLKFYSHPILGNLELDFTDSSGKAADTVIFAGENGTGKSTILRELYALSSGTIKDSSGRYQYGYSMDWYTGRPEKWTILPPYWSRDSNPSTWLKVEFEYYPNGNQEEKHNLSVEFSCDDSITDVEPKLNGESFEEIRAEHWQRGISASLEEKSSYLSYSLTDSELTPYPLTGLFASKDVVLETGREGKITDGGDRNIRDSGESSKKDAENLLIRLQSEDDADIAYLIKANPDKSLHSLRFTPRLDRFERAFNSMFCDSGLRYSRILNMDFGNEKNVFFERGERIFPIQNLSSGEQEIVYRICFLLKGLQDTDFFAERRENPIVFLDEPEASLHPLWQKRILECYRNLFSDDKGRQTSQIFVATHSPYLIHNPPINSKVIVLKRDASGNVSQGEAEYPTYGSTQAIRDAFHIDPPQTPTVYLEGIFDERYFNKTLEIYGLQGKVPFLFKQIGHTDEKGKDTFSGKDNMKDAENFLIGHATCKTVLLYDCDVQKQERDYKQTVYVRKMKQVDSHPWKIRCGIENALVLDACPLKKTDYYTCRVNEKGEEHYAFEKRKLCDDLCKQDNHVLEKVFVHLKEEIDKLIPIFNSSSFSGCDSGE